MGAVDGDLVVSAESLERLGAERDERASRILDLRDYVQIAEQVHSESDGKVGLWPIFNLVRWIDERLGLSLLGRHNEIRQLVEFRTKEFVVSHFFVQNPVQGCGSFGSGIDVLHGVFYVCRHDPEKIDHVRVDLQFWLGKCDPVFSGFDPEIHHRPLPEIASAFGFAWAVFLSALPARTELDRNIRVHAFSDCHRLSRPRLRALHLQRIHPERLKRRKKSIKFYSFLFVPDGFYRVFPGS